MHALMDRVVVVTGGASGIGRAMAVRFAAAGARVVIADIEEGPLQVTAAALGMTGVQTDVSSIESMNRLRDRVLEQFGVVHVLCNNAGVGGGGRAENLSLKDWQWVLGVNLWGVIHGIDAFLPTLLAQDEAHMVNTASMAGLMAYPNVPIHYNATKYAVVGISETLRNELADGSVHVSVLCPGFVRTNIMKSQRNRPDELRNEARNPTGRAMSASLAASPVSLLEAGDVAEMVHDAVMNNRFWVVTHSELLPLLDERHGALMAEAAVSAKRRADR